MIKIRCERIRGETVPSSRAVVFASRILNFHPRQTSSRQIFASTRFAQFNSKVVAFHGTVWKAQMKSTQSAHRIKRPTDVRRQQQRPANEISNCTFQCASRHSKNRFPSDDLFNKKEFSRTLSAENVYANFDDSLLLALPAISIPIHSWDLDFTISELTFPFSDIVALISSLPASDALLNCKFAVELKPQTKRNFYEREISPKIIFISTSA